jgi:hypothetical protein
VVHVLDVRQKNMHLFKSLIIAIFGIALVSCATTYTTSAPARSLVADFQEAEKLMTSDDFDSVAIADLRSRLHARLRLEGDEAFASALDTNSRDEARFGRQRDWIFGSK